MFLRPCSNRSHATCAPIGAAFNSDANGAFMTCSSVNEAYAGRTQARRGASAQRRRAEDFIGAVSTLFHGRPRMRRVALKLSHERQRVGYLKDEPLRAAWEAAVERGSVPPAGLYTRTVNADSV